MTYELQYRKVGDTTWLNAPDVGTSTSATIEDLVAGDEYELRVRAKNAEGVSDRFFWIHPAPPKLCTPRAGPRWSIEQGAPPSISRSPRRTACKPATTGCRSTGTISRHTFDGGRAATSTACDQQAGNHFAMDIWSDGATMYVWYDDRKIYAYRMSDGTRDTSRDLTLSYRNINTLSAQFHACGGV